MSKPCWKCHSSVDVDYNSKYDALYCDKCNIWLEEKCSDPFCTDCTKRPDKPKVKK